MTNWLKDEKQICRDYLRTAYTDEDLIRGLTAARAGILAYNSCCCFGGIPTNGGQEPVPTRGDKEFSDWYRKYKYHCLRHSAMGMGFGYPETVSTAYSRMGRPVRDVFLEFEAADALRRRRVIPLFLAEIRRRKKVSNTERNLMVEEEGILNESQCL